MNQPETARALLYRHGLPEDVIDGALCLHAQELAAVQRADAQARHDRSYSDNRIFELKGARNAADLIDPTKGAVSSAGQAPATNHTDPRCVCGDPIEWRDYEDGSGWIHSPGADTPCLDARPASAVLPAPSPTTNRRAILHEAAALLDQRASGIDALSSSDFGEEARAVRELTRAATELRRLADETPDTQTESSEPTAEEIVRDHVTALHLIGEQLAAIEGWFWEHLADVRAAAEPAAGARQDDETCATCRGSGLDPRYNGEFACLECSAAAGARQDGDQPSLRDRHRATWQALTPDQQTARLAELDEEQGGDQT